MNASDTPAEIIREVTYADFIGNMNYQETVEDILDKLPIYQARPAVISNINLVKDTCVVPNIANPVATYSYENYTSKDLTVVQPDGSRFICKPKTGYTDLNTVRGWFAIRKHLELRGDELNTWADYYIRMLDIAEYEVKNILARKYGNIDRIPQAELDAALLQSMPNYYVIKEVKALRSQDGYRYVSYSQPMPKSLCYTELYLIATEDVIDELTEFYDPKTAHVVSLKPIDQASNHPFAEGRVNEDNIYKLWNSQYPSIKKNIGYGITYVTSKTHAPSFYSWFGNSIIEIKPSFDRSALEDSIRYSWLVAREQGLGYQIKTVTLPLQEAIEKIGLYTSEEKAKEGRWKDYNHKLKIETSDLEFKSMQSRYESQLLETKANIKELEKKLKEVTKSKEEVVDSLQKSLNSKEALLEEVSYQKKELHTTIESLQRQLHEHESHRNKSEIAAMSAVKEILSIVVKFAPIVLMLLTSLNLSKAKAA